MDARGRNELYSIRTELNSVIREMENIIYVLQTECSGIGMDKCIRSIDTVLEKYRGAKRRLDNMDTTTVKAGFAAGNGGSSGGGGSTRSY